LNGFSVEALPQKKRSSRSIASILIPKETINMSQNTEHLATQNLHVEELEDRYGLTEEELASASIVCTTCTCTGAEEVEAPAQVEAARF
jgi:phosphopantetheine adenylyltransferase